MMSSIHKWGLALSLALPLSWFSLDSDGAERSYVAGNFALELDGGFAGFVKSLGGGTAVGEVIEEAAGGVAFTRKHIGRARFEDIKINVDPSAAAPLLDWIAASWQARAPRKNGAIISYDSSLNAVQRTAFTGGLLSETTIPACDGASKEAAYLTLGISPERTQVAKASGKAPAAGKSQKAWLASNFHLDIDGLDTSKVVRVNEFTVKTKPLQSSVSGRASVKEPGKLEIPNLFVTLGAANADSWSKWHSEMVNGATGDKFERTGRLVFLAPDLKQELLVIKLSGVGIVALRTATAAGKADTVPRLEAELYVENMELVHKLGAAK